MSAESIKKNIAEFVGKSTSELTGDTPLRSLVQDSFVLVELVMQLQEDFEVRIGQEDLAEVTTIGQLCKVITDKQSQ